MKISLFQFVRRAGTLCLLLFVTVCGISKEIVPIKVSAIYQDSISTFLENAELIKATKSAVEYFDLVKSNYSQNEYLNSIDLLYKCYKRQNKYVEVLSFLKKEQNWAISEGDQYINLYLKFYLGSLFKEMNENDSAIEYFLEIMGVLESGAFNLMSEYEVAISKIRILSDLGSIMVSIDSDKTLKYFNEAKLISQEIDDSIYIADSYLNIGWALLEMDNYNSAKSYLDSALVIFDRLDNYNGRVSVYLEKGILHEHKSNENEALNFYLKSYSILFNDPIDTKKSYFLKQKTLKLLVEFHSRNEDFDNALKYAMECLNFVTRHKDRKQIARIANEIAKIHEAKNNDLLALKYYKQSNENYEILRFEDARMDVLKKESAFNDKRNDEQVRGLESNLKSKETRIAYFIFFIAALGFISAYIFKRMRRNGLQKEKKIKIKEEIIYQKNQSMTQLSLINQSKNQFIEYLKEKLQSIYNESETKSPEIKKLIFQMKTSVNKEDEWLRIRKNHMELEPTFYKALQERWPHLTNLDIRHCTLLKLKMSNNEASEILGISPKSVQMARYRLKKKLNYDSQLSLKNYIASM